MASSMEWTPRPASKAGFAAKIDVCRYDPDGAPGKRYETLPNIQCDQIQYREGASPPAARFRYILDDRARARGWPSQFEEIVRLHGKADPGPADESPSKPERAERYVVKTDDRLVVLKRDPADPKARPEILFDGFAQGPQVDVSGKGQQVTFVAAGVAIRCWDEPIVAAVVRDADEDWPVDEPREHRVYTRVVFNEDIANRGGNCADVLSRAGPAFRDPAYNRRRRNDGQFDWSLDRFARYLLETHNADEEFVDNPDPKTLKALLMNRRPKDGRQFYDPDDSDTYNELEITIPEYDATGKAWPEALAAMLEHHGFAMAFRCEADEKGEPWNWLEVYRKDAAGPYEPKTVSFQKTGGTLDPAKQSVGSMAITRDYASSFNSAVGLLRPALVEISVVLAPGFPVSAGALDREGVSAYLMSSMSRFQAGNRDRFRLWVCEEIKGKTVPLDANRKYAHGVFNEDAVLDLAAAFDAIGGAEKRRYPGLSHLVSAEVNRDGKRSSARLDVSTDYAGPINAFWDKTGTWEGVPQGRGWKLLDDRLGVYLTCENPMAWNIGERDGKRIIDLTKMLGAPDDKNKTLFFRLTVAIEKPSSLYRTVKRDNGLGGLITFWGDPVEYGVGVAAIANRPQSSALKYERKAYIDVGSVRNELVHESSPNFNVALRPEVEMSVGEKPHRLNVYTDGGKVAGLYAEQMRARAANPPIAGTIEIPWTSLAYQIGDQIREVSGRGLSLQVNAGDEQGEAPQYPYIIGVDWGFAGGQSTTLHLSDRRAEPRLRG